MTRSSPAKPRDTVASPVHDPIAPWCADVLALYGGPLGEVRFPDVECTTLERAAEAVRQAQLEVESLERSLDDARGRTQVSNAALAELCGRALAYARVFATAQPELQVAVDAVRAHAERPSPDVAPKKRGRPRKDSVTVELLPDDAPHLAIAAP